MDTAAWLAAHTRFKRLIRVARCESTQELARGDELPGDAAYWSDHQEGGRGRHGRAWRDEPGLDVAVTFRAGLRLEQPARLAPAVPAAVLEALEAAWGGRLSCKWPNDVHLGGRKLAGILIDAAGGNPPSYLIGVGVNVNSVTFPGELSEHATSLRLATGATLDRGRLVCDLAASLERALGELEREDRGRLEALFRDRLGLVGKWVEVVGPGFASAGRLADVDLDALRLEGGAPVPLASVLSLRAR